LRVCSLAALVMAVCVATAAAQDVRTHDTPILDIPIQEPRMQEMRTPRIVRTPVDWNEVTNQFDQSTEPAAKSIERLNQATEKLFANIAASPVPVLLPFNSAQLLRDAAAGANGTHANGANGNGANGNGTNHAAAGYLIEVRPASFFQAGPGGYDAVFSVYAKDMPSSDVSYPERIDVHISGSALLYELDEPAGMIGWPVTGGLSTDFPGIKRFYLESGVRYTFVRYGVPYVVSLECHDGGRRFHKMSCRDADRIAIRILRSLQVAGGTPHPQAGPVVVDTIDRPQAPSPVFTYHSPGDLVPGTGMRGHAGRADYTVYSKIRFPLAEAPAFANSQSFMHWGDCDQTGRVSLGTLGKTALYRCRVNGQLLIADESVNYAYPWRDNFCEHRYFFVGECPAGLGHQGQDIRPSSCTQRIEGANRCEPYQHDVVAARDGIVLRAPGDIALHILTNSANERVRFRYLHMFPKFLDRDGILSGREVHEGEVIGKVGNYQRRERATTYHLHFDMQVPTKYGWVFVNPYMTLVAAYERAINARGRELSSEGTPVAAGSTPLPAPSAAALGPLPAPLGPLQAPAAALGALPTPLGPLQAPAGALGGIPAPAAVARIPAPAAVARIPAPAALARIPAPAALGGIPAPAANPIEIEIQSDVLHRIMSETAGNARPRRTAD
jgi:hypothetical protein